MNIGDKIKELRKGKKITQEQLAEYLNVSAQAISKWETGLSSPDIEMLPKLAMFFQTTIDAILDYNQKKLEKEVEKIIEDSIPLRCDPVKAEAFYRDALIKYPNNEDLLNCLLMTIGNDRVQEKIEIGEQLLTITSDDEIKYDVLRLMAQMYHQIGQDYIAEHYLEKIPELYFLKTEIAAAIRTGNEKLKAIQLTENVCYSTILSMILLRKMETTNKSLLEQYDHMANQIIDLYEKNKVNSSDVERLKNEYFTGKLLEFYQ